MQGCRGKTERRCGRKKEEEEGRKLEEAGGRCSASCAPVQHCNSQSQRSATSSTPHVNHPSVGVPVDNTAEILIAAIPFSRIAASGSILLASLVRDTAAEVQKQGGDDLPTIAENFSANRSPFCSVLHTHRLALELLGSTAELTSMYLSSFFLENSRDHSF